jgi:putative peptidoglycan lipid II flippase
MAAGEALPMSDERPVAPKSPRTGGWQPRDLVPARFRGSRPTSAPPPAAPPPAAPPALPAAAPQAEAAARPARPPREEYTPFVPRAPLPFRRSAAIATSDVGGDVVLTTDGGAADLGGSSLGRLSGRGLAMAGLVVMSGVILSRLLGWARTSVLLAEFGARSRPLDAFYTAFTIPDLLFQLIAAGAIGSALVPVASALIAGGEDERARKLISTMTNLVVLVMAPLAAVAWLLSPVLVPLIALGYSPNDVATTIELTRLMLLSPILLAVGAVMAAGLNSHGIFGAPALAPNAYNIAIIAAAIVLTPFLGVMALAWGVALGALGSVLAQALPVLRNRLYEPLMDLHDPAVRETLMLMGPRALGLGATQLVFVVLMMFTTTLPGGDVSRFRSVFIALQIPVGLIGVPLGIILLPPLSQAFALGQHDRFRQLVDQSLRLLLFVVIPMTGMMLALAAPTIALLFQYGKVDASASAAMVPVYVVFLLGLIAHVMIALLAPIFYAGKDTRTPVTAALLAVAVDIGAAIVLFPFFHLQGLALAIGLGAWAEVIMLVVLMEKRVGFDLRPLLRHSVSFAGGACVASAAAFMTARFIDGQTGGLASVFARVVELVPAGLVGLVVYLAWARLFRLPELQAALGMARSLVRRRQTQAEPDEV